MLNRYEMFNLIVWSEKEGLRLEIAQPFFDSQSRQMHPVPDSCKEALFSSVQEVRQERRLKTRDKFIQNETFTKIWLLEDMILIQPTCTSALALNNMMQTKAKTSLAMRSLGLARWGNTLMTAPMSFSSICSSRMRLTCLKDQMRLAQLAEFVEPTQNDRIR